MSEKCPLFEDSGRLRDKNSTTFAEIFYLSNQRCPLFVDSLRRDNKNDTIFAKKFRCSNTTIPPCFSRRRSKGDYLRGISDKITDG